MNGGWLDDWLASIARGEWDAEPLTAGKPVRPADDYSFARKPPPAPAGWPEGMPFGDPVNPFSQAALDARKFTAHIQVSEELLMDQGAIPDTRPPLPPPTWRTRLRRKREAWRERAAKRAYKIIAGYEPPNLEDW